MEGDYEMNKQEAIRLARKGIKVRHMYFSPEEWMYINPMDRIHFDQEPKGQGGQQSDRGNSGQSLDRR